MAGYASISLTSGIAGQLGKGQIIFHTSDEVPGEASTNTMTEKVRIAYNGYLGVGTPTPTQRLEVAGTVYSTSGGFKFPDGSVQTIAATGTNTGDQILPTTLPASDVYAWAKASIKPSYDYSEISSTPTTLPNANAITFATTGGAAAGSTYTGAAVLTVDYATVGAAPAGHTHSYQAADNDLLAIGGLTGTSGYLKKTAADTWTLDTSVFLTAEADTLATVTGRGATTATAVTFSGGITGDLTGNASGLSAVLAVASGGTGTATPALVAGTNVTITGTWPNQTINSTGSSGTTAVTNITRTATGTGSQAAFTVTSGVTKDSVIVTENGVLQTPTTDYTVSGTTLTFTTAPASGVQIQIRELGSLGTQESLSPFMLMGA